MNSLPKDYTKQENIIADCLSEFGLRYDQQYSFFPYTVDFFIPELSLVVEADGIHGHFKQNDAKRDIGLLKLEEVKHVIHIRESTMESIKQHLVTSLATLWTLS